MNFQINNDQIFASSVFEKPNFQIQTKDTSDDPEMPKFGFSSPILKFDQIGKN